MKMKVLSAFSLLLFTAAAQAASLPAGYTAVEYIESTSGGGQYINTGYTPHKGTKVICRILDNGTDTSKEYGSIFGSRQGWSRTKGMYFWLRRDGYTEPCYGRAGGHDYKEKATFPFGEVATVTCEGHTCSWANDAGRIANSIMLSADYVEDQEDGITPLLIFALNSSAEVGGCNPSDHWGFRLYSFRIYEGTALKRDFVPCVSATEGVGLWDAVEGMFYPNAGSGAFLAGPSLSLTLNKVETANPWDGSKGTITVDYSLNGVDSGIGYQVAFDITANGQTAGVTNAAAKLESGAKTKVIDTVALFGREIVAKDAKVKVSLISMPRPQAGQLWSGGPIWAVSNLGVSEDLTNHPDWGAMYTFDDAVDEVSKLGDGWRLPTDEECQRFKTESATCTWKWDGTKKGQTFTGMGPYVANSLYFPSTGYVDPKYPDMRFLKDYGYYWTSEECSPAGNVYIFMFTDIYITGVNYPHGSDRNAPMAIRVVKDCSDNLSEADGKVVDAAEAGFWLGPGCESSPWTVGENVTAYIKDGSLVLQGEGEVAEAPWTEYDDILTGIGQMPRAITIPVSVAMTMPISLNGVTHVPVPAGAVMNWTALTNAIATAEKGAEIAVGSDITEANGELVVPKGKEVAIKLYGKTVTCGSVMVGGALTVGDAEDLVGKIVASDGAKITSSGLVTLLGGPVRGTFTTQSAGLIFVVR